MDKRLSNAQIKFPKYWQEELVLESIQNLHNEDLLELFECANNAALTRKLNPCFPNRPARVTFRQYIKDLLEQPEPETLADRLRRQDVER